MPGEIKSISYEKTGRLQFAINVLAKIEQSWDGVANLSGATSPELTVYAEGKRDGIKLCRMIIEWLDVCDPLRKTSLVATISKAEEAFIEGLLSIEGLHYESPAIYNAENNPEVRE